MNNMTIAPEKTALVIAACCVMLFNTAVAAGMSDSEKARFGLSQSLNNVQKHTEAAKFLAVLYKKHQGDAKIAHEYVKALGYGGQPDSAIPIMEKLLKKNPNNKEFILTQASIMETAGKHKASRSYYNKLYTLTNDASYILKVADLSTWLKEYAEAEKNYKLHIKTKGMTDSAVNGLLEALIQQKRNEEALDLLKSYKGKDVGELDVTERAGDLYAAMKKFDEAIVNYRKVLAADPSRKKAALKLADTLRFAGKDEEALKVYESFLSEEE
jgi:tetratricopeptide (TPR) repeat protein